jgi:hypothetical protein
MSKETPLDDSRQRTDWGSHKQTDKPWKGIRRRNSDRMGQSPILRDGKRQIRIEELLMQEVGIGFEIFYGVGARSDFWRPAISLPKSVRDPGRRRNRPRAL